MGATIAIDVRKRPQAEGEAHETSPSRGAFSVSFRLSGKLKRRGKSSGGGTCDFL